MARRRTGSISVYVDVDVDQGEVLGQVTDEALVEEMKSRGLSVGPKVNDSAEEWRDFVEELRASFQSRDGLHFEVLLVRLLSMANVERLHIPTANTQGVL